MIIRLESDSFEEQDSQEVLRKTSERQGISRASPPVQLINRRFGITHISFGKIADPGTRAGCGVLKGVHTTRPVCTRTPNAVEEQSTRELSLQLDLQSKESNSPCALSGAWSSLADWSAQDATEFRDLRLCRTERCHSDCTGNMAGKCFHAGSFMCSRRTLCASDSPTWPLI